MGIGFLHPWLWAALAAVAAPVWLHLARKRVVRVVRFSALRFLDDQPAPRRRPLDLRDLPLLALRALALLFLVAAFTWPYLRRTVPLIQESRVYILDNTMSQQARDGFARGRERVLAALRSPAGDSENAVIVLDAQPRVIVPFGTEGAVAQQAVADLAPSFQRGSYLAAFRQADELLRRGLGTRKRIVFVGDNQENQWAEARHAPPFLHDVMVDLPPVDVEMAPNLALVEPAVRRVFTGVRTLADLNVKLRHSGPARAATVRVQADGATVMERNVVLPEDAEEIVLQAAWTADPAQWLRGELTVTGEPDVLPADNRVFFASPPVREGTVTVVAHSPFLQMALAPEVMRGRWAARVRATSAITSADAAAPFADVLCLEGSALQSAAVRELLHAYLGAGKGVLLLIDRLTPLISGSLHELGFEPDEIVAGSEQRFQTIAMSHPLLRPFRSLELGNLTEVTVSHYVRLRAAQATPLLVTPSGDGLLLESRRAPGALLVAAFGFDRNQTNWPLHPSFIPFLDLTFQHLRQSSHPTPAPFEPAQAALLPVPPGVRAVHLQQPDGSHQAFEAAAGRVRLRLPEQPGVYAVTYDADPAVQALLVVNPPPLESSLRYIDPQATIASWRQTSAAPAEAERPANPMPEDPLHTGALQQRLWWWLLMGTLTALLVESVWVSLRGAER